MKALKMPAQRTGEIKLIIKQITEYMNRRAVVFGATGLVGKEVVSCLLNDEAFSKVITVGRRRTGHDHPKIEEIIIDDFARLSDVKDQLDASVYFCCVGTTIKNAGSREAFSRVDLEIPRQIAQMAESMAVKTMVIISSLGADPGSSNFYLRTKGEMEQGVRHLYSGKLIIVRPSLLMGRRDEFRLGERVAVVFMKAFGWFFAGPLRRYRGIRSGDVAKAMIKLSAAATDKEIFESVELSEIAEK